MSNDNEDLHKSIVDVLDLYAERLGFTRGELISKLNDAITYRRLGCGEDVYDDCPETTSETGIRSKEMF